MTDQTLPPPIPPISPPKNGLLAVNPPFSFPCFWKFYDAKSDGITAESGFFLVEKVHKRVQTGEIWKTSIVYIGRYLTPQQNAEVLYQPPPPFFTSYHRPLFTAPTRSTVRPCGGMDVLIIVYLKANCRNVQSHPMMPDYNYNLYIPGHLLLNLKTRVFDCLFVWSSRKFSKDAIAQLVVSGCHASMACFSQLCWFYFYR